MGGSIVIAKDILTSARFRRVAKQLAARNGSNAVTQRDVTLLLGGLAQLWIYADTHIREDNTIDLTADEIDELVGIAGFANLLPGDWLEILDSDCVQLPDFLEHNGTTARKKALAAQRQRRFRDRHKNNAGNGSNDDSDALRRDVTPPSHPVPSHPEEESRERAPTATRLPTDFDLTTERRAIAVGEGLDAERTFAKFIDYWRGASGARARKHDWDATWRNWCRTEADRSRGVTKTAVDETRVRREREAADMQRLKDWARDVGYPHPPHAEDTPATYETRIKTWKAQGGTRNAQGPRPASAILAGGAK